MSFESEQQAAEALLNAIEQDKSVNQDTPSFHQRREAALETGHQPDARDAEQADAPAQDGSEAEGTIDAPEESDSFTGIDPSTLEGEALALYRSMQADYTRSKQAIAEQRKAFESIEEFGGVDAAREAVEFVSRLASDPEYALEVHGELTKALIDAGHTPQQAERIAAQQVSEAASTAPDDDDDFGFVDSELKSKLEAQAKQLEELRKWREDEEERRLQESMWAEMERQQAEIVRDYKFNDEEVDYVYKLAYSTGGDLKRAAEVFVDLQKNVLAGYMDRKGSTPAPGDNLPTQSSGQQPPEKFTDLNDPKLEQLAQERLRREGFEV